jgi:hypothetical protein
VVEVVMAMLMGANFRVLGPDARRFKLRHARWALAVGAVPVWPGMRSLPV